MGEDLMLKNQLLKEIGKREEKRLRQKEESEERAKEEVRQKILKSFEDELARLLREREKFENFRISDEYVCRKYIRKVAKELGFIVEMVYSYEKRQHFFVFTVPESQAEQRTFAQERLEKFEGDLKKAKFWRKSRIKEECRRVLKEIRNGNYGDYENDKIYIKSEEEKLDLDDKSEITSFFSKYNLIFLAFSNGKLYFWL